MGVSRRSLTRRSNGSWALHCRRSRRSLRFLNLPFTSDNWYQKTNILESEGLSMRYPQRPEFLAPFRCRIVLAENRRVCNTASTHLKV